MILLGWQAKAIGCYPIATKVARGAVPESQLKICSIDHWGDEDLYTVFVVSSILTSSTIITVFDPPLSTIKHK